MLVLIVLYPGHHFSWYVRSTPKYISWVHAAIFIVFYVVFSGQLIPPFDHCIICSSSIYASDYPFKLSSLICVFCNLLHILTLDNRIVGEGYWENRNQLTYSELQSKCEFVQFFVYLLFIYVLFVGDSIIKMHDWDPIYRFNTDNFVCLTKPRTVSIKTYAVDFPFCI